MLLRLLGAGRDGIDIIEPRESLGRGLAYSTPFERHFLNVPADKMDMFAEPSDPSFVPWLEALAPEYAPKGYAPRWLYGDFLEAAVVGAMRGHDVRHVQHQASAIERTEGGLRVRLDSAEVLPAGAVVLALGNLPPARLAPHLDDPRVIEDPWRIEPGAAIGAETVVVAGTGLTALDAVISIAAVNPSARFVLCAAHPFMPPADRIVPLWDGGECLVGSSPRAAWSRAKRTIREHPDRGAGWYEVVDGIRPHTEAIWAAWSEVEQRSFFAHGARHWLHHRHRTAPPTVREIDLLVRSGRLALRRGRIRNIAAADGAYRIILESGETTADLVINATGPSLDIAAHPLLRDGLASGIVSRCPLGLGIAVTQTGQALGSDGRPVAGLYALGPLTRGAFFEVLAVPHIRRRAADIAAALVGDAPAPPGYGLRETARGTI
jgi:uncharacterized NAD(P)/FAD-binding protein YdhS